MDRDESIGWYREVIKSLEQDTVTDEIFTDQTAIEFSGFLTTPHTIDKAFET